MKTITTIAALRAALAEHRRAGKSIGLVPTMGYLHVGHMELVRRARSENHVVVASIFVNPLQFGPSEDLAKYPRDLARDERMLEEGGVDFLFAPSVADMYPRPMETVVDLPKLGSELEGAVRPGHFAGVATVVSKLFNIAQPDRAYFGEKDFQQLQIIRRMVEDLAQPVAVVGVPTVREDDGLACSSRNIYLTAEERRAAAIVPKALDEAERLIASGESDPGAVEKGVTEFLSSEPLARPEVVALRDPDTLEPIGKIGDKPVLLLLFVRFGTTKLLDNRVIAPNSASYAKVA
ncbi:pantoate--beta-alanine ligase [Sinorhizobium alkalisoli]|uniref:Pantothenate synthetase n=1 Tax=Sinorhizobium alkalisoli TaxID=1752398 RepID=A0A1E3V5W3_9HYPH|nr:pantoate--beta-alanine ligase [Sinorhizobium alkalisoli]MCA1491670.1 pantoate--beta-alanine ligase [Ensifer sp. NBAIM29]MCG5479782.1 pantoate--beta-alanine ligase [Sinorhizobium alkalisoli]ODR88236.1 pantoate--beta-alanine ligase [Sinorhizobium alkalisoli]QFI67031.1 Pantoate--beta-alanine ligase [Sinorhizobium alkalisoli]